MARLVVPGLPHHVTQRGVRRMAVFSDDGDYRAYLALLVEWCAAADTEIWAYCLMPNHVHLILVPSTSDGLRAALGETHRRYARRVHLREDWHGHLWQERFHSFAMDEDHLVACARYVERNPVRAGLTRRARDWRWSSARAHLDGIDDGVAAVAPLLDRIPDWSTLLDEPDDETMLERLRGHARSGYVLGAEDFREALERRLGRSVQPRRPGRPRRSAKTER